jgi:hypothetical protein
MHGFLHLFRHKLEMNALIQAFCIGGVGPLHVLKLDDYTKKMIIGCLSEKELRKRSRKKAYI